MYQTVFNFGIAAAVLIHNIGKITQLFNIAYCFRFVRENINSQALNNIENVALMKSTD